MTWDSLEFITVQPETDDSSTVERMFVRTYENVCRPRYECMQFRLAAPGVLLYRRSLYRIWPFNGTTGIIVDCRSLFTYDQVGYRLLVSASGLHARCRLPADLVDEQLDVEFKSGLRCRGVIRLGGTRTSESETGNNRTSTSFQLLLRDCPAGHDSEQVYRCLDSSGRYTGSTAEAGNAVLVSADGAGGDLLCWWFGSVDPTRFFLLSASDCYSGQMAATLKPLAVFSRSVSATISAVVTATSLSIPSDELSRPEIDPVTDVISSSCNISSHWRILVALVFVAYVSTILLDRSLV